MTAVDIFVLFLIGAGAVFGFLRGFVQESLSLIAWVLVIAALRFLHAPLADALAGPVGTISGAAVLSFLIIGIVTYGLGRWAAASMGSKARKSVLGPFDRVLGFGFGAIKGLIGASLLFLLFVLVYETAFGAATERPEWLTKSRTYPLLNASGDAISRFVAQRRGEAEAPAEPEGAAKGGKGG